MPGMGLETSMIEMAERLFLILAVLVGVAILAAAMNLPLFFGTLFYKIVWFWSADVTTGGPIKRSFAALIRVALPAFSVLATVIGVGYFGGFDLPYRMFVKLPPGQPGPTERPIRESYDGFAQRIGTIWKPALPEGETIYWKRCPDRARQLIEVDSVARTPQEFPLDKAIPAAPPSVPPVNPDTPEPTPDAVFAEVRRLIADSRSEQLYVGVPDDYALDKKELDAAQIIYEKAIKDSKWNQTVKTRQFRSISLYGFLVLGPIPLCVFGAAAIFGRRSVILVMRSLMRSLLRTSLTYFAVFVLVFILCAIWSVLTFLDQITKQQEGNLRGIITEKYQIPSQMKPSHYARIKGILAEMPEGQRPANIEENTMTWAFVLGTLDPNKKSFQNMVFFIATEPERVMTMIPDLDNLTGEDQEKLKRAAAEMTSNRRAIVMGAERLRQLGKRVGDKMQITSLNYKGITFDFQIVGELPAGGRWEGGAFMNRAYLDNELDSFKARTGKEHELADKCMNLIWIKLPNMRSFDTLSDKISDPGTFTPAIKMEIESSAYANFLSPYKTLVSFMRYGLAPGLLIIVTLVTSLVIGIGVRERKTEIAVLKVLGFRPRMVLGLIIGESLLIGTLSGFMATATSYTAVNGFLGGIPLPIGFFGKFYVPEDGLWWGPAIGAITATISSILPSMTAYKIKASQVFSRVT